MKTVMAHPVHRPLFARAQIRTGERDATMIGDARLVFQEHLPKWRKRWEFPKERFVEYEKSDEKWCRAFGIGHEVDSDEPFIIEVDPDLFFRMNWMALAPMRPAFSMKMVLS